MNAFGGRGIYPWLLLLPGGQHFLLVVVVGGRAGVLFVDNKFERSKPDAEGLLIEAASAYEECGLELCGSGASSESADVNVVGVMLGANVTADMGRAAGGMP